MAQVLQPRTNDGAALWAGCRGLLERAVDWFVDRLHLRAQRTLNPMTIQPLSAMTAALQALLEQQRALDQREVQEEGERFGSPSERDMNLQAINHLERAMACVAAQEPRDAVIQVLIAAGHTQVLEQESCEQPLAEELGIVLKLLRSALPVLARHTEVDIEGFGASHYGLGSNAIRAPRAVRPGNGRPAGTTGPSDDPDDHP